ncbi:MAG: 50S ribosomal protein L4 [Candidatus Coatesbacteria bacterium]|nr:MAG: 50S ribosomal protein L4 [Candidatus Coatesbacteria bacterium]RLC44706.1 MAG: 50S ribosomal protein L4 [Candidatus Coatesbacteria bacterium]
MKFGVVNIEGEKVSEIEVEDGLFTEPLHEELIYQVVVSQLANMRAGTASTKTRAEVKGGGRKPWRQKGTGRARHGSIRSPIWVGGGITFGPRPRNYKKRIPKKMKRKALRSIVSSRVSDGAITVVDEFVMDEYKTRKVVEILSKLNLYGKKVLILVDGYSDYIFKSVNNIPGVKILPAERLNVYDVITSEHLLFSRDGLKRAVEVFGE